MTVDCVAHIITITFLDILTLRLCTSDMLLRWSDHKGFKDNRRMVNNISEILSKWVYQVFARSESSKQDEYKEETV